jgi:dolichyl-phosphate beta-glucosyltransferase
MKEALDLSIIIPAYNEEKRLPPTLKRMLHNLETFPGTYEIIVIDDGSRDNTSAVAKEFAAQHSNVSVVTNTINQGRGGVMRQGILSAPAGRYILDTDADGSTDDEAITRFYQYLESHKDVDMIIGSRTIEGAKILTPQPFLRVALGYIFMAIACILFRWRFVDRVNGFKLIRKEAALDIFANQYDNTFLAEAEIVYVAERRKWQTKELPILWTDNRDSRIKPWSESVRSLMGMLRIVWTDIQGGYRKGAGKSQFNTHGDKNK